MPRLAQPAPQVAGAPAPISPETAIPPPEKPAPALTEPTATTSMRASCAWKGLSAQRCTAISCASKGVALARHVGEELLSGFAPFTQADTSTTREYGGTGLGLTICARLVSMMGGRVWCESEVGRGGQFHFTARLKFLANKAEMGGIVPYETLRGMRVLIVDDNATNRKILQGMLRRWELRTRDVESGEQALAELLSGRAAGDPYRLILTR